MALEVNEYGYYIEILKNGKPIAELQLEAVHDATITDKRTLAACQKITVKDGDKITAKLTSRADPNGRKGKYTVESTLSLERVAIF